MARVSPSIQHRRPAGPEESGAHAEVPPWDSAPSGPDGQEPSLT